MNEPGGKRGKELESKESTVECVRKYYYAHSVEGKPPEQWQPLDEHLKNVAKMAAEFAKPFGGEEWAYLAGLCS